LNRAQRARALCDGLQLRDYGIAKRERDAITNYEELMALPPKSVGTGRYVMAAPILDQGGEVAYMATGHQFDLPYSGALRVGRQTRSVRRRNMAGD
jgi:hypothetical protein